MAEKIIKEIKFDPSTFEALKKIADKQEEDIGEIIARAIGSQEFIENNKDKIYIKKDGSFNKLLFK